MFHSIKHFLKTYSFSIFAVLLGIAIYYSIFEIYNKNDQKGYPLSEAESMQREFPDNPIKNTQEIPDAQTPKLTPKVPLLNIRQEPDTTSNILGTLTPNDSIEILETKGDWVRFQSLNPASKKTGWVMRKFLNEI